MAIPKHLSYSPRDSIVAFQNETPLLVKVAEDKEVIFNSTPLNWHLVLYNFTGNRFFPPAYVRLERPKFENH